MALVLKPHLALIERVSAVMAGNRILRYERTAAGSVAGQMTEKSADEVRHGFGMETVRPAVWLMEPGAADVAAGDRLTVNDRVYRVVAGPKVKDAEALTAHWVFVCERDD